MSDEKHIDKDDGCSGDTSEDTVISDDVIQQMKKINKATLKTMKRMKEMMTALNSQSRLSPANSPRYSSEHALKKRVDQLETEVSELRSKLADHDKIISELQNKKSC